MLFRFYKLSQHHNPRDLAWTSEAWMPLHIFSGVGLGTRRSGPTFKLRWLTWNPSVVWWHPLLSRLHPQFIFLTLTCKQNSKTLLINEKRFSPTVLFSRNLKAATSYILFGVSQLISLIHQLATSLSNSYWRWLGKPTPLAWQPYRTANRRQCDETVLSLCSVLMIPDPLF